MPKSVLNVALKGADEIFSTEESRQTEQREQVQQIPIAELFPFKDHPFRVQDDEEMENAVKSISQYGVLTPLIARPRPEGGYEIISGHRRQHAAQLAGLETVPVIVRDMSDDAATILMVDSNLQRENILPSERAFAYKMKMEAMKHQGARSDLTSTHDVSKLRSNEKLGAENNQSRETVRRFIRLTYLVSQLLDMVDQKQISLNPAVELSYLNEEQQKAFIEAMDATQNAPSFSQAKKLRKLAEEGHLSSDSAYVIMNEVKKDELDKVVIKNDTLRKYFPENSTPREMQEQIVGLLEKNKSTQLVFANDALKKYFPKGYDSDSSWQCSKYRNMYVSCTSHFIKTSTIEAAILNAIKAMTKEIIENEDEFAEQLQAAWENQNTQVSSESKKELHSVQKRIDELDALIRSLYENSVLGKIPERQYQRLMAQYDEEQAVCEARIAELKKELDVVETTKVDLKRFIKLIRKYKDCETLTDEMLYELVEKVVIHSASGGRTIYRQQQIDIYFNFIGDTFPSQIEISRGDKKNLTEQQLAKRKKYQKTAGENRKKKRAALREAAKTDPQAAAEYEALLQKGRERCRKYAQNKKLAQQEPADTVPIQFEPSEEMKGESA